MNEAEKYAEQMIKTIKFEALTNEQQSIKIAIRMIDFTFKYMDKENVERLFFFAECKKILCIKLGKL